MKPGILLFIFCSAFALTPLIGQGEKASLMKPTSQDPVKVGLLIPVEKSKSARQGAELAIDEANEKGGYKGRSFRLVVKSMEGPWGTGSKAAVSLIFDDEVSAIVGSHDGRNAHLVEQVTTKTRIVFLSAWASDPTLSQAFVPWYFSCVANDLQQADALIKIIYGRKTNPKIAAVSLDDYDSKLGLESLLKKTKAVGKPDPLQLIYRPDPLNAGDLLDQISKAGINCLLLFGERSAYAGLLEQIVRRKMNLSVYGSLAFIGDEHISDATLHPDAKGVEIPSGNWSVSRFTAFNKAYRGKYGVSPDARACYAYDGMNVIIEAIKTGGTDRENIQKSLFALHYEGITGTLMFDGKGNRAENLRVMKILNGLPVTVNTD